MDENRLFKIGEVAKMYHVSMGTLRHYEKEGLLTPEYTDENTGYRYYGVRQLEVLNTIGYLRVLDMPLSEIRDFIQNRDVELIEEKLLNQKQIVSAKIRDLELISKKLDHRLEFLRDASESELEVITEKIIPPERIVQVREKLELGTYLGLEGSIRRFQENQDKILVVLGKVGVGISEDNLRHGRYVYDRAFLILDDEEEYRGDVELIPAQRCVTIRFRGSHNEAPEHYGRLMEYIEEKHLEMTDFAREITLIDNGLTSDTSKFVTEIRIPVGDATRQS